MAVIINKETCIGCGACIDTCAVEALEMVDEKAVCDAEKCVDCGACSWVCLAGEVRQTS